MKRIALMAALAVCLASPAHAGHYHRYQFDNTFIPPHWLLDRGPRVIDVPEYTPAPEQSSPSLAIPFHAETNEEAAARARAQARLCAPVRLYTDDGLILHRPTECR